MFPLIATIFLVVPIIEIYLLIQVGQVIGAGWTILMVVLTAVIGVWIASCGFIGYLYRPIGPVFRIAFVAAGLALLLPGNAVPHGITINVAGGVLVVLLVGREYLSRRSDRGSTQTAST